MAKRSQPHLIEIPNVPKPHRVSSRYYSSLLASGAISPKRLPDGRTSRRIARLNVEVFILTSWLIIDRRNPMIRGWFYRREIERQYVGRIVPMILERRVQLEGSS